MSTEASPWQPIDTAPKTALKRIDLLDGGKRRVPDCYWSRHHQKWRSKHFDQYGQRLKVRNATHWMFSPKRPEPDDTGNDRGPQDIQLARLRETLRPTLEEWARDYGLPAGKEHVQLENRLVAAMMAMHQGGTITINNMAEGPEREEE